VRAAPSILRSAARRFQLPRLPLSLFVISYESFMMRAHTTLIASLMACASWATAGAQTPPALFAEGAFSAGVGRVADVAFSPDGRMIAAVGATGALAVWDTQSRAAVRQVAISQDATVRVAFGGPSIVAAGTERGLVSALNLLTGQVREVARHQRNAVTAVAVAPDGSMGASGDANGDLLVWPLDGGQAERLREDTKREPIVFLAFTGPTTLISVTRDLGVTLWDVPKRRSVRRGTLQLEALGRSADFSSASTDPAGTQLALASQYLARQRAGALLGGAARPEDLRRTNVIVPYGTDNGLAGDPIQLGDFLAERIALSPGSCFAVFSSNYREQPRIHVWSMVKQGQDLVRTELPARPTAVAADATGRYVAAGFPSGEIRVWRMSGATKSDCDLYRNAQAPPAPKAGPRMALGSEATPLIPSGAGFKVAVLRFEVGGVDEFLGDAVAEMVGGELANSKSVVVVERAAVNALVKEMQLQASGLTASDAVRLGRGLNAQKVLLGGIRRFGEGTYVVTARVVDVETQQVQGSREVSCESCTAADLPAVVRLLRQAIVP
jgi:TolB-like protein